MDGLETVEFLARSPIRIRILQELTAEESLTREDFRRRLDASRTTVQRNLDDLVERRLISHGARNYSINAGSEYILEALLDSIEAAEVVEQIQPFLEWVDRDDLDFSLSRLARAELVTPRAGDPYAMINRHVEKVKESNNGRIMLPFTGLHATEAGYEQIMDNGAEYELIVKPTVVETFRSKPQYLEKIGDLVTSARFELLEYDGDIPFALCLLDETVQIIVAEGDEPRAMLASDDAELREQAEAVYEEYRAQATTVDLTS